MLWNFVENNEWDVPSICKIARLVILPKPNAKSSQPIHQRLIALLCIPYLAYSKARFTECIPWQLAVFPENVCGGISGRKASDITHTLAMESELSISTGEAIIGIKLDRSKCFDRIVVKIIVELGIVLGLDSKFLISWAKLYDGFERYICWNSCISDKPLKNSNGIAQGDTASVLAINILMSSWSLMISSFPNVRSAVFVDDAYMLAKVEHATELAQALQATKAFDLLAGQALNLAKSSVWATSAKARKLLPRHFSELLVENFVGVLGGFIKADAHPRIFDASSPFHTIKALISDIASLPIDFRARVRLISAKVIPKITFNAEVKPWARKCIESFTSAITNALWKDRPIWRSTEILFALATNPIACHPPSAIAATTICNIVARCRQDPEFMKSWHELQKAKIVKKGLLDLFIEACKTLKLNFRPPCSLGFLDFPVCHFLDLVPSALRKLLRLAASQSLYQDALLSKRKDFVQGGSGILDTDSSSLPRHVKPWWTYKFPFDENFYLGPLTGALPTANRLYKAELADSPCCRFCGAPSETIQHLTECIKVAEVLGPQTCPMESQPQWKTHGIMEVPQHLVDAMKQEPDPPTMVFRNPGSNITLWTDGSVVGGHHMFSRSLGFAVIDHNGSVVCAQGFRDLWATSFKAELLGVLFALKASIPHVTGSITVVTDCWSLVKRARKLQQLTEVPLNTPYWKIWNEIFDLVQFGNRSRLIMKWIRAHQADGDQRAANFDQQMNRVADNVAKNCALEAAPLAPSVIASYKAHLHFSRVWLVKLSKLVGENRLQSSDNIVNDNSELVVSPGEIVDTHLQSMKDRFVKWPWDDNESLYNWAMNAQILPKPKTWAHSDFWWSTMWNFFQKLKWIQGDGMGMSIYELAFRFWQESKLVPPEVTSKSGDSFMLLVLWVRHFIREAKKVKAVLFPPSVVYEPRKVWYASHTFPYGRFLNGRIFASNSHLHSFASWMIKLPNGGKKAADWTQSLNSLPWPYERRYRSVPDTQFRGNNLFIFLKGPL